MECLLQVGPNSLVDALHGKHAFNVVGKASRNSYSNKTQQLRTRGNSDEEHVRAENRHFSQRRVKHEKGGDQGRLLMLLRTYFPKSASPDRRGSSKLAVKE